VEGIIYKTPFCTSLVIALFGCFKGETPLDIPPTLAESPCAKPLELHLNGVTIRVSLECQDFLNTLNERNLSIEKNNSFQYTKIRVMTSLSILLSMDILNCVNSTSGTAHFQQINT